LCVESAATLKISLKFDGTRAISEGNATVISFITGLCPITTTERPLSYVQMMSRKVLVGITNVGATVALIAGHRDRYHRLGHLSDYKFILYRVGLMK
jgi:hypothetical protein